MVNLKLALLTPSISVRGGAERIILRIAKHFDATVHCLDYDPENTYDEFSSLNIEIAKGFRWKMRYVDMLQRIWYFRNLKLEGYDLINPHQDPTELAANNNSPVLWHCYTPARFAYDSYEWMMGRPSLIDKITIFGGAALFRALESQAVPKIDYIFTNSFNCHDRIKKYLKRDSEVLYCGIDSGKFSCRDHERFFLYPSRIALAKDFEYAINAFKAFSRNNPGWKLVIAGALSNEAENQNYLKRLKSMTDNNILIETNVSEDRLHDLYSRCYAVLYSPINEDFGMVPLEGMASSKPCIAKNEGGCRETVMEGKDGFLVNNPEEMALRMEQLAKDPERCEAMGKAGRAKVVKEFTWDIFIKRFEARAKEVVENQSKRQIH